METHAEPPVTLDPMTLDDYDEVYDLWKRSPGVYISSADTRDGVERYLERNPGLSVVARADGRLVGVMLCGHDGRRGIMHHLAVDPGVQRRGVARRVVEECVARLKAAGIGGAWIMVLADNEAGLGFWKSLGLRIAEDTRVMFMSF